MVEDLPTSALEILSTHMDLLLGSVLNVSQQEIGKARAQVEDLGRALKEKKETEREHLEVAEQLEVILRGLYEQCPEEMDDPLLNSIIMILESEREYHLDQASRAHVQREEGRLRDARGQLRLLIMKRRLAHAIAKRSGR